jgi:hypothetical protein
MIGLVASFQLSAPTRVPDMGASHRSCAKELRGCVGVFTPLPAPPLFVACTVRRPGLPHAIAALQKRFDSSSSASPWSIFRSMKLPNSTSDAGVFSGQGAPLRARVGHGDTDE